jgi:hypothetical protein
VTSRQPIVNLDVDVLILGGIRFPTQNSNRNTKAGEIGQEPITLSFLSRFLSHTTTDPVGEPLKHMLSSQENSTSEILLNLAKSSLDVFSAIIKDISGFASYNDTVSGVDEEQEEADRIQFTLGVKEQVAIENKAKRKYGGDVLQVKDVLRASIVFPCEGSLVCGLLRLLEIEGQPNGYEVDGGNVKLQIVQVKNLFASPSPIGLLERSPLPTGYRHILVSVRLNNGILAGKSFHRKSLLCH